MLSLKKISLFTLIKILGAILSVLYYLLQVDYFGVSRTIECYFIAGSLTAFLLSLTQVGHLSGHFLPIYHQLESEQGKATANASYWVVVNWLLIICAIAVLVSFFLSKPLVALIAPGFDGASKALAADLFQVLAGSIFLQLLNIKSNLLLNALNIFNRSELYNVIRALTGILTLYFGYQDWGVWALIWGIYLGHAITLILNWRLLYRYGIRYQLVLSTPHFNHRSFFKNLLFIYPFIFSKRFFDFVLTAAVSFLPQGVYAIYKYVESIFLKTGGIILTPTTNVFFTNYSISSAKNATDTPGLLHKAFRINLLVALYTILLVFGFGEAIVQFFWFDKMEGAQHQLAYLILVTSFISLLFAAIGGLCFKMLFVLRKTKPLYIGRAVINLILALYAFLAIRFWKETGLISVIVFSALLSNLLFVWLAYDQKIKSLFKGLFLLKVVFIFVAGLGMGWVINQLNIPTVGSGRIAIFVLLFMKTVLLSIGVGILFLLLNPSIEMNSKASKNLTYNQAENGE